ncbi:MAG: hypothetical protein EOQ39_18980 [Mesorhizobium sp.]|uniref:hypothetical protein n=1 Tax=Mesorhizobium sp. TaxID=1871066 RepID=UPI000FE66055|nr:hypothetical protein [Mesorhizobium sp.]RWB08743.1 MAG: hypothetical protein EOQ37_04355 [Mesorhizobium sp.]RWB13604.1 MAG: hypothetical protein EOQ39_18980 [Mesorhizobium sp.]
MRYVLEYVRAHPQQKRHFFFRHNGRTMWSDGTSDVPRYWTKAGAEGALHILPKSEKQHLKVTKVGVFG